jgi:hypothetical protein
MAAERFLAWLASLIGNSMMFGAIVAGWAQGPARFPSDLMVGRLIVVEVGAPAFCRPLLCSADH